MACAVVFVDDEDEAANWCGMQDINGPEDELGWNFQPDEDSNVDPDQLIAGLFD